MLIARDIFVLGKRFSNISRLKLDVGKFLRIDVFTTMVLCLTLRVAELAWLFLNAIQLSRDNFCYDSLHVTPHTVEARRRT